MGRHPMPGFLWRIVNGKNHRLSGDIPRLSFSMKQLCDFAAHYALYDETGDVKAVTCTFREALCRRRASGLYLTRILD